MMAKSFKALVENLPPERRRRIAKRKQQLLAELALNELRQARRLTQQQLAESLNISQASVSKMESQSDMYVSTLRRFLEAMGGELRIVAAFPDGEVLIHLFEELDEDHPESVAS
jgi:transcriptional regulator with XRE-family HTH domain